MSDTYCTIKIVLIITVGTLAHVHSRHICVSKISILQTHVYMSSRNLFLSTNKSRALGPTTCEYFTLLCLFVTNPSIINVLFFRHSDTIHFTYIINTHYRMSKIRSTEEKGGNEAEERCAIPQGSTIKSARPHHAIQIYWRNG